MRPTAADATHFDGTTEGAVVQIWRPAHPEGPARSFGPPRHSLKQLVPDGKDRGKADARQHSTADEPPAVEHFVYELEVSGDAEEEEPAE
jgi:hypothetical protein